MYMKRGNTTVLLIIVIALLFLCGVVLYFFIMPLDTSEVGIGVVQDTVLEVNNAQDAVFGDMRAVGYGKQGFADGDDRCGAVAVFERYGNVFVRIETIKPGSHGVGVCETDSIGYGESRFGSGDNIAIHKNTLAVGRVAYGKERTSAIYMFERNRDGLLALTDVITPKSHNLFIGDDRYHFGTSITLRDGILAAPLKRYSYDSHKQDVTIYLFKKKGDSWKVFDTIEAGSLSDSGYGIGLIDFSGTVLVAGEYSGDRYEPGRPNLLLHIFEKQGNGWEHTAIDLFEMGIVPPANKGFVGTSFNAISLFDGTIAVGMGYVDEVVIIEKVGGEWVVVSEISPDEDVISALDYQSFGMEVFLYDNDTLAVYGQFFLPSSTLDTDHTYFFKRKNGNWRLYNTIDGIAPNLRGGKWQGVNFYDNNWFGGSIAPPLFMMHDDE